MSATQLTHEERAELVQMVLEVFRHWAVPVQAHPVLLGLPEKTSARALLKYQQGSQFPDEAQFIAHAEMILKIHRGIQTLFPGNANMANYWMTTDSYQFGDQCPLEVMYQRGLDGMREVLDHINGESW